jgi:poly(beta-D-mannuronate) lyase
MNMKLFIPALLMILVASFALAEETTVSNVHQLRKAIAAAKPGDAIVVADGTYQNADIEFFAEGTKELPITLRAQTPGKVILTGESKLRIGGTWLVVSGLSFRDGYITDGHVILFQRENGGGSTHCRLTDTSIVDYNPPNPHELRNNTYWISLYGHDNEVDHCYLKGKDTGGPTFVVWVEGRANEHRIHHNYFAGRPPLGRNGGETMRIGLSGVSMNTSRTLVEYNLFENCDGESEIISNKSCENVYRHNTFINSQGTLCLRHGNRCTVEGNWFFGNGKRETGGIRVIGEDHKVFNNYLSGLRGHGFNAGMPIVEGIPNSPLNGYWQVKRAIIAFNTFFDCTYNVTVGAGKGTKGDLPRDLPPLDCTFANNLMVGRTPTTQPALRFEDQPQNMTWIGNVIFGLEPGLPQEVLDRGGAKVIDPKLEESQQKIVKPAADSPVAGAAATTQPSDFSFVTEDIEGKPRDPARRTVGSFEASSNGEVRYRPLTPADVGPSWMR